MVVALATATARFYTYDDHPDWAYALTLFLPSIVCAFDRLCPVHKVYLRPVLAATLSAFAIGLLFWVFHLRESA
jgi:hypothetical protein